MVKIGIFGGTFNPVHNAHLVAAQEVREKMELTRVIFVPSAHPPHKVEKNLAAAAHRLNMLKLAIEKIPYFSVSTLEIDRGGKSYSVDTMRELRKKYGKKTEFYFILGVDAVMDISTWKDVDTFLDLCNLVVINRPGFSLANAKGELPSMRTLSITSIGISSSYIKNRIKEGKPITYMVPEKVEKYIRRYKLYQRNVKRKA
ncbi:MAG: nicotinate-nucleotide adenylyltransferase [Candidatus Omnitrophica bacterium]|nr:nicotinate-nucleotide adenylyltransferase [Candidatus Omnitrophota bacterium]